MPRIVFITPHYLGQYRRTNFFWIANAFHRKNWQVLFFTSPISFISVLNRDNRFRFPVWSERQKMIEKQPYFFSFVHFTLLHKVAFDKIIRHSKVAQFIGSILNIILAPLCHLVQIKFGESASFIRHADVFVFESSPSLELLDDFIQLNDKAKLIYRVSDDLRLVRVHPDTHAYEQKNLKRFDRVSVQSSALFERIKTLEPNCHAVIDFHGVNKQLFDLCDTSPYDNNQVNAVFIGIGDVDYNFLETAVKIKPSWHFHIIGPLRTIKGSNVTHYGEIPFEQTIPYVKYADIGLQCRAYAIGAESFTDTLKVLQYTYCGLAIVAPIFLKTQRQNTFYYEPKNTESILQALDQAKGYKKDNDKSNYDIKSWTELVDAWIEDLDLTKNS